MARRVAPAAPAGPVAAAWAAVGAKNGAGRWPEADGMSVPWPGGVAGAIATLSAGPEAVVGAGLAGPACAGAAPLTGVIDPGTSSAANRYQAADQPSGVGSHHSSGNGSWLAELQIP